jgi:drug/metabolite transporter (DMT)-like permease
MNIKSRTIYDYLGLFICVIAWGSAFVFIRSVAKDMTPMTMAMFRLVFAALFFLPIAIKNRHTTTLKEIWDCKYYLLILSIFGAAGYMFNMCIGLTYTTATNAALINGINPIVTVFAAAVFVRVPVKKSAILPLILAVLGAIILIWFKPANTSQAFSLNIGDMFFIANVIMWAVFSVALIPFNNRLHWAVWGFIINVIGVVILLLMTPWFPISFEGITLMDCLKISYVGFVCGGVATALWNNGISRLGIATASLFNNLNPLSSVVFAMIFLGEKMVFNQVIGAVLILGSLIAYTLIDFIKHLQWQKAETQTKQNTSS